MNQDKHFRETREQREILNQVMPLAYAGYVWHTSDFTDLPGFHSFTFFTPASLSLWKGYTVGGEFWSLPQHLGDQLTGIATTLTQTERGLKKPITHVGHPGTIHREMGKQFHPFSLVTELFIGRIGINGILHNLTPYRILFSPSFWGILFIFQESFLLRLSVQLLDLGLRVLTCNTGHRNLNTLCRTWT